MKKTAFLINLNQVHYCLIFRRACYFTFPLSFIHIFENMSQKWTKVCNWKYVNSSCSWPLSVPKVAWGRVYTPLPPLESQLLHMVRSWNLYQRYFLAKDVDWWRHCFGHVTHRYFTDQKTIFADVSISEKMTSSMNFFYQGELLVKDSSWYHLQIPRYCMVVNFPYNSWSVNSDHPKTRTILRMLRGLMRGYFNFKMFATKFCSLGQSFISIAQVILVL